MFQKIFWKEQKIAISVNPCQKIWRGQNWKSPKQRQNPSAAKEQQKELPGVCPLSAVNAASPRRTSGHPRGVSGNIPEVRIIRLSQWTGTSVPRPPGEKWCDERKLQIKWPCIYWSWMNTPTRPHLKNNTITVCFQQYYCNRTWSSCNCSTGNFDLPFFEETYINLWIPISCWIAQRLYSSWLIWIIILSYSLIYKLNIFFMVNASYSYHWS